MKLKPQESPLLQLDRVVTKLKEITTQILERNLKKISTPDQTTGQDRLLE